jgi:hypothetical protein
VRPIAACGFCLTGLQSKGLQLYLGKENGFMTYPHIVQTVKLVRLIENQGKMVFLELEKFIKSTQLMAPVDSERHPNWLHLPVSFHGLRIDFHIEIRWSKAPTGILAAYYSTYDMTKPEKRLLVECEFNGDCGDVIMFDGQPTAPSAFPPYFIGKVFDEIEEQELRLRP